MTDTEIPVRGDWAGSLRAYGVAWGVPSIAIIAGSLVDPSVRSAIWVVALIWMGSACLLNSRRCGRTHCRYTGPFYLALTIPVALQGLELYSFGPYAWWILGVTILAGGKVIWWGTEVVFGRYRPSVR